MSEKENPYTGTTYECTCDYTYTCRNCEMVREVYAERRHREGMDEWLASSLQKIAKQLNIELDEQPVKPMF
jgi:hypothetical protein